MATLFLITFQKFWVPALYHFFYRAYVNISVVEEWFHLRHIYLNQHQPPIGLLYWNLPENLKYITHRRVFDAKGSNFVDGNIHSSFWEEQADYKRSYVRVIEPSSSTQDTQPLPPEIEGNFKSRRKNTLIGTLIGVAILFYFVRFAGYFLKPLSNITYT